MRGHVFFGGGAGFTGTLAAVFVLQMTIVQFLEVGLPLLKKKWKLAKGEAHLRQKMSAEGLESDGVIEKMKPEEEEASLEQFAGVFSEYQEMVVQFGYVTLFAGEPMLLGLFFFVIGLFLGLFLTASMCM